MFVLCLMIFLNICQNSYATPLSINEKVAQLFFGGILDIQQRVGIVKLKENAPVEEAIILLEANNGDSQEIILKKGEVCSLSERFPCATFCKVTILEPFAYRTTPKSVRIDPC